MAKDRAQDAMAKNQQKWEKKKEKLEKKSQSTRGLQRQNEKDEKKIQKQNVLINWLKEAKSHPAVGRRVYYFKFISSMLLSVSYLISMTLYSAPALSTTIAAVALVTITVAGEAWREHLIKQEERQEAASHIKGQLDRFQMLKHLQDKAKERRMQWMKEAEERQKHRKEAEKSAFQQAMERARALRLEREADEKKAAAARSNANEASSELPDAFGWRESERIKLREAVMRYPEAWSHASKKRWEMIASEVGSHNARACEAEYSRLQALKSTKTTEKGQTANSSNSGGLMDDLDWMGDAEDATTALLSEEDDDDDEDEGHEDGRRERMAVEVDPEHKGTEIRLEGIKATLGWATVQVEVLHLQLSCASCRTNCSFYLSGADEDASDAKTWCEGCSSLNSARLRPTLLHGSDNRLCYVDCVNCNVVDVLPSVLMSTCEKCGDENVHKQEFIRNRIIDGTCFSCHSKYAFGAESIKILQVTPCEKGPGASSSSKRSKSSTEDDAMDEITEELRWLRKKAKSDPKEQLIQLGRPLPQLGACSHFKKSFRWYRFACCGRAFPCPQCHSDAGCPAANLGAVAGRMICGKCSMEQSYAPNRPCEKCGFSMQPKGSSHWDDGCGTRNLAAMSAKDAKKFKGGLRQANSKTKTSSGKADRVGTKAKQRREQEQKFGREK